MLHPSYSDLMKVVNSEVEPGEAPIVNSRYSIVMATSKRARQIIDGEEALISTNKIKPLSMAVEELNQGKIKILTEEEQRRAREAFLAAPPEEAAEETSEEASEDTSEASNENKDTADVAAADAETADPEAADAETAEQEITEENKSDAE